MHQCSMHSEFKIRSDYDFSKSSEDNYRDDNAQFVGKYSQERSHLDYTFHKRYSEERQRLQDELIDHFLSVAVCDERLNNFISPDENWIVFTAGAMGAGKGHTIQWLHRQGLFPFDAFINVDPDLIRSLLPEINEYNRLDNQTAGKLTQKEVGYISEVLSYDALNKRRNVLVDGSLRDARWYIQYFRDLRTKFSHLLIGIIHITAKLDTILERAYKRGLVTGRMVPEDVIRESLQTIPLSIETLSPSVNFIATFANENDYPEPYLISCARKNKECSRVKWELSCVRCGGADGAAMTYLHRDLVRGEEEQLDSWKSKFANVWMVDCYLPYDSSKDRNGYLPGMPELSQSRESNGSSSDHPNKKTKNDLEPTASDGFL